MTERRPDEARRNFRLALLLVLVALAFYVGFFFSVSHRGH